MAVNSSGIIISQLAQASSLNDSNIMPVIQENMTTGEAVKETRKTTLGAIKEFFLSAIPAWAKAAQKPAYTAAEVGAATPLEAAAAAGDALNNAKAYTNTRLEDYLTSVEFTGIYQNLQQTITDLQTARHEQQYLIEYLIQLIESNIGQLNGTFPLMIEGGYYLVTENGDYLVAA